MICIKADIPKELSDIEDKLKTIYHSKNIVFFFIFKDREQQNEFAEKIKGMTKEECMVLYTEEWEKQKTEYNK